MLCYIISNCTLLLEIFSLPCHMLVYFVIQQRPYFIWVTCMFCNVLHVNMLYAIYIYTHVYICILYIHKVHTYIYVLLGLYIVACIHAYIYIHVCLHIQWQIHKHKHLYDVWMNALTYTHTGTHAHTHTHIQTHTHTHTHTHIHTSMHTHMHTRMHTHTYIYVYVYTKLQICWKHGCFGYMCFRIASNADF